MVLAIAIESILLYVGDVLGTFISMTFSNAALLITSVLLLRSGQLTVLQVSLVGAILSNLLLMPGLAFLLGGLNRVQQYYSLAVARTTGAMLFLAIGSLLIPATFQLFVNQRGIVPQSRGASMMLLICYGFYMIFQFKTHKSEYLTSSQKSPKRDAGKDRPADQPALNAAYLASSKDNDAVAIVESEAERPELSLLGAFLTLTVVTTLLTFNTLFATDSIQGLLQRLGINSFFLGLVIIPMISNDPTTVIVGVKDRQELMLLLTLGRCIQIALLVFPFIVLLAWWIGVHLALKFDIFQTAILFMGIVVINYVILSGISHWLLGMLLLTIYMVIVIAAWFYPDPGASSV